MDDEYKFSEIAPWLVLTLTAVGGILRVFLLGNKGMWLDETFSVWLASHNLNDMLRWMVQIDQHPPLYYLLLHYWIALEGDKAGAVRLLSVLFGAATIPIIYLIGKRLSGALVGLAAAVFLAFSPYNIFYAQETRMYTLLTFNAAVAIYALAWLLTDPRSVRPIGSQLREYLHAWRTSRPVEPGAKKEFSYEDENRGQTGWRGWIARHPRPPIQTIETDLAWVAFIVFSAATLLSHNTAVFFILATNLFVLGLMLYQRIKPSGSPPALQAPSFSNWVKAQIGTFLLWSPWIVAFYTQVTRVDQEFWVPKPTWDIVTGTLRALLDASAPGQASQVVILWIMAAVFCLGLVHYRKRLSIFFFLAALFAIPVLGELVVSLRRPIFLDRTLIWITLPMLLLLAAGIIQLRFRLLIILVLGILAANYLFSTSDYYRYFQKEDWRSAAQYVTAFAEKDDLVLFNSAFVQIPFDYYLKSFDPNSKQVQKALQVEKHGVPGDMYDSGILEPIMTEKDIPGLISRVSGHDRVWLVYSHNSYTDPLGLVPQTLASKMKLIQESDFYGGKVQLYGTP